MIPASDYVAIRAFVAVAEALSFTRAADALGVSHSALSQTIRGLEDRAGVRLLHRTTRSVGLTDAGKALLARVRPALDALGGAVDQLRTSDGRPAGLVRVHSFRTAAELFLTPLLPDFTQRYPQIVLDITLDDTVVDVVAGGFDAAIRVGEVIERDMVAVKLGSELRQVAVAAPSYLAARGCPQTPRDLHAHTCIRWRWPGHASPYAWEFFEDGRWFSVAVDGPLIASSRDFGVNAAAQGVGIAFAIEEVVAPYIADGRLIPLLETWSAPFPGFYLCYPQQRHMSPALRALIDAITALRPLRSP